MVESSNRCKPWRLQVRHTALDLRPDGWYAMLDKPMAISATFVFARPKNHFRTNGHLKPAAPQHCITRVGDVDKLCRACLDALADGAIFNDDAQVVSLFASRRFAHDREQPSAIITITALS